MSKQLNFIASIAPGAMSAHKATGVFASVTIAQAILESSWGASELSKSANNYFGIKADPSWGGDTIVRNTKEYVRGKPTTVKAVFRSYKTSAGSVEDHADFLCDNSRYAKAFDAKDGCSFAEAIANAGYATDPRYADKLKNIIQTYDLEQYDERI